QRSGDVVNAKEHFKRFQHLSSTKIGAPIGLAYGEQGHYSIVTPVAEPQAVQKAMIPVKLVASPIALSPDASSPTGGACMMDVAGSGRMDLVLMQNGAHAIRVLRANGD